MSDDLAARVGKLCQGADHETLAQIGVALLAVVLADARDPKAMAGAFRKAALAGAANIRTRVSPAQSA